jgi:hypothetical protein
MHRAIARPPPHPAAPTRARCGRARWQVAALLPLLRRSRATHVLATPALWALAASSGAGARPERRAPRPQP